MLWVYIGGAIAQHFDALSPQKVLIPWHPPLPVPPCSPGQSLNYLLSSWACLALRMLSELGHVYVPLLLGLFHSACSF